MVAQKIMIFSPALTFSAVTISPGRMTPTELPHRLVTTGTKVKKRFDVFRNAVNVATVPRPFPEACNNLAGMFQVNEVVLSTELK